MKIPSQAFLFPAIFILCSSLPALAQIPADNRNAALNQPPNDKSLFDSDEILHLTLQGDVRNLLKDRADKPQYHPLILTCKEKEGENISLAVNIKTRGHFRKLEENCVYPPLLIRFSKSDTLSISVFRNCDKLKLVMPCRGDEYVIREWLVYKLYNLVTPKSFRARLVSVSMDDVKVKKRSDPFYGILIEDEKQMAARNNAVSVNLKLNPAQTDTGTFLEMAVFQFLIGNTDWSVQYLQNIKLLQTGSSSLPIPVPYDFDHAGFVNAPYAYPAEELRMRSVRERRYRGYCIPDLKVFDEVIAKYNLLKKDMYAVFTGCSLLDSRYIGSTQKYFDEFYATINNVKSVAKEFAYPCDKNGTGNVVIKGLGKMEPE